MKEIESLLSDILNTEEQKIRKTYPSEDVEFALIEIIRSLDFYTFILPQDPEIEGREFILEKYRFGWSLAFSIFYNDLKVNDNIPLFTFPNNLRDWVDSVIQKCGEIQLGRQLLSYHTVYFGGNLPT